MSEPVAPSPPSTPLVGPACAARPKVSSKLTEHLIPGRHLMPLEGKSPAGVDDVGFLGAEDDEVKVRLRIEDDGSLTIVALAPNTRLADGLLDNVPPDRVRTELCG